jgi:hypothetical protein
VEKKPVNKKTVSKKTLNKETVIEKIVNKKTVNEKTVGKKKIMNNSTLSRKEKRQDFLKLKPKCINCKRPGGSIFSVKSYGSTSEEREEKDSKDYKEFRARCGIIADPCNLNITIQTGNYNLLPDIINKIENEIKQSKDIIIDNKNKLLFGYITTETAIQDFENEKIFVEGYTSLLEEYLNAYIKITDNPEKQKDLEESLEKSYEFIDSIKESIRQFNETESTQFIKDVVDMYITNLQPFFRKIMALKYRENLVYYDETTNTFHLIQKKNTIKSMEYSSFADKVVNYDVGLKAKINKNFDLKIPVQTIATSKKPAPFIIESSSDEEDNEESETGTTINVSTGSDDMWAKNLDQEE